MAMTICRECSNDVSSAAKTCPHCGVVRPDAEQARRGMAGDVVLAVIVGLVLLVVIVLVVEAVA